MGYMLFVLADGELVNISVAAPDADGYVVLCFLVFAALSAAGAENRRAQNALCRNEQAQNSFDLYHNDLRKVFTCSKLLHNSALNYNMDM